MKEQQKIIDSQKAENQKQSSELLKHQDENEKQNTEIEQLKVLLETIIKENNLFRETNTKIE